MLCLYLSRQTLCLCFGKLYFPYSMLNSWLGVKKNMYYFIKSEFTCLKVCIEGLLRVSLKKKKLTNKAIN